MSRGDNQYQQWLTEQEGASRLSSERYGAGVPYWKMRTDFEEDKRERLKRRNARNDDGIGIDHPEVPGLFFRGRPGQAGYLAAGLHSRDRDAEERDAERGAGRLAGPDAKRATGRQAAGPGAVSRRRGCGGDERGKERQTDSARACTLERIRGSSRTQPKPTDVLERSRRL